jgi:AcrR family transcriptional regulator
MPDHSNTSPLRESQLQITRKRILESMARLVTESGAFSVTHSSIASVALVSERTIYRHYPTKDQLWDDFLLWVSERVGLEELPQNEGQLIAAISTMFQRFDEHEELLRQCLEANAWSEIWMRGRKGWKESVENAVLSAAEQADRRKAAQIGAMVQLLFSGISWKTIKDHWALSTEEATEAVEFTLKLLFDELKREHKRLH